MAQQPQTSLNGARADTAVPQNLQAPQQLNANAMNQQVQTAQMRGMPTAQAVNQAASNPNNKYYKDGGDVRLSSADTLDNTVANTRVNPAELNTLTKALEGETALKGTNSAKEYYSNKEDPVRSYDSKEGRQMLQDRANMMQKGYAKGGDVHKSMKDMPLKDIVKMLAAHPEVAGGSSMAGNMPMKGTDMAKGGLLNPTANTAGKSEARSHGKGLLAMNDDVGSYAEGGEVSDSDDEVLDNTAGNEDGKAPPPMLSGDKGLLKMAAGGSTGDMEADNITGYNPDGTPIIQNSSGGQQTGNINDLLGRPSNASTLGTGATPTNSTSKATGNALGNGTATNMMAKGGEEDGPPPGSLSKEVADDVPAKLSAGEFVFSADVVRFYGLRLLNQMMEHARGSLNEMNNEGTIRHPGDGKNPNTGSQEDGGHFVQDQAPNVHAYDDDGDGGMEDEKGEDQLKGLLGACSGGSMGYATGGGIDEPEVGTEGATTFTGGHIAGGPQGGGPHIDEPKEEGYDPYRMIRQDNHENPEYNDTVMSISQRAGSQISKELAEQYGVSSKSLGPKKGIYGWVKAANIKAKGGLINMSTGGGVGEEQSLAKGGSVYNRDEYPVGRDNMVSPHPKGGAVPNDYAKGGIITSTSTNMFPKKSDSLIPSGQAKIPGLKKSFAGTNALPKMKKGGLLGYNGAINSDTHQSYEGA